MGTEVGVETKSLQIFVNHFNIFQKARVATNRNPDVKLTLLMKL
jgi:hypothetical protein